MDDGWDLASYPLWHGSMRMSELVTLGGPSKLLVAGEGAWVTDAAGRRLLDARAGISNMTLGYGRGDIVEAMTRQASQLPFACSLRYERLAPVTLDYARALVDVAPEGLTRVRFTHTGSSAIESALLIARLFNRNRGAPSKHWIVGLEDSYHGTSLMTMAASGEPILHELFGPMPQGFAHAPKPRFDHCPGCGAESSPQEACIAPLQSLLAQLGPDKVAAVIVEPVMGNEIYPLTRHFLSSLRSLCDDLDILLIFDEVVTGFGRVGTMFAADHFGVTPDLLCVAKAMTAGYATMGAVLASEKVFRGFDLPGRPHLPHGSSTDGHPVACAAGLAVLEAYRRDDVLESARTTSARLRDGLSIALGDLPTVRNLRGLGAFMAFDIVEPDGGRARLERMRSFELECDRRGVLVGYAGDKVFLAPPLSLTADEVDLICETVASALAASPRAVS